MKRFLLLVSLFSIPAAAQTTGTGYMMDASGTYATAYTQAVTDNGGSATLTLTPTGKPWAPNLVAKPFTLLSGTWSPASINPTAGSSAPIAFTFTPTPGTSGTGSLTSTVVPTATSLSYVAAAASNRPALSIASATYGAAKFGNGLTSGGGGAAVVLAAGASWSLTGWVSQNAVAGYDALLAVRSAADPQVRFGILNGNGNAFDVITTPDEGTAGYAQNGINSGSGKHVRLQFLSTGSGKGTFSLWVDGVSQLAKTGVTGLPANPVVYVAPASGGGGYVDEVMLSTATIDPSANFTPPTAAATADANTLGLWHLNGSGVSE